MCVTVLVQQSRKAETQGSLRTGSGSKMNLVRFANCHSAEWRLAVSAEMLMDTGEEFGGGIT